ncbi:MAG: hypothetical protein MUP99_08810, partial [Pedobacter sp.]|nr:hypothetical protein [Pedobacter sp.]
MAKITNLIVIKSPFYRIPFYYLCSMIDVVLKKGKEKAALQRHPWIFSGAIDKVKGTPVNGEVVKAYAADQ